MHKLLGYLTGAASVLGLSWLVRHGDNGCCGAADPLQHCGCSQCRRKRMAQRLFLHLETTPGQEKAIGAALEEFMDKLGQHGRALRQSAGAVGRWIRGTQFDEELLQQIFAQHDVVLAEARQDLVALLRRLHESLDDAQRARLARFIESPPAWHSSWRPCHQCWTSHCR